MIGITNTIISKYNLGYIQNGLMQHYDGIQNLRTGHSSVTTRWEDLTGSWDLIDAYGGGYKIQNNCYYFPSRGVLRFETAYNLVPVQLDFVVTCLDTSENYLLSGWANSWPTVCTRGGGICVGNSSACSAAVSLNTFHTISIIWESKHIYMDGTLATLGNYSTGNGYSGSTRSIGGYNAIDNYSWNGNIYAIRFYNRELTANEIAHNHALDARRFNS